MSKKSIIISSVLLSIIVVIIILFGAVFCLRKQYVSVLGDQPLVQLVPGEDGEYAEITKDQIIKAAGFKKGKSIFMLDKHQAIKNIESAYPMVKVVQIKTKSVISVQFIVRPRVATYYTLTEGEQYNVKNQVYCIMDEELMAMDGVSYSEQKPEELNSYVELIIDKSLDCKNENNGLGNYFTNEKVRKITTNLYNSFCSTVAVEEGKINPTATPNATRKEFAEIIKSVTLYTPTTNNKDLNELLEGTINMSLKVMLDGKEYTINIAVAEKDLLTKVNKSFNTAANYLNSGSLDPNITTFNCGYDKITHEITVTAT